MFSLPSFRFSLRLGVLLLLNFLLRLSLLLLNFLRWLLSWLLIFSLLGSGSGGWAGTPLKGPAGTVSAASGRSTPAGAGEDFRLQPQPEKHE